MSFPIELKLLGPVKMMKKVMGVRMFRLVMFVKDGSGHTQS